MQRHRLPDVWCVLYSVQAPSKAERWVRLQMPFALFTAVWVLSARPVMYCCVVFSHNRKLLSWLCNVHCLLSLVTVPWWSNCIVHCAVQSTGSTVRTDVDLFYFVRLLYCSKPVERERERVRVNLFSRQCSLAYFSAILTLNLVGQ